MQLIHQPLDFMGQNIYNVITCVRGADGEPEFVDREPGFSEDGVQLAGDTKKHFIME